MKQYSFLRKGDPIMSAVNQLLDDLNTYELEICRKAAPIYQEIMDLYEDRKRAGDQSHLDFGIGVANSRGKLGKDGSAHPSAPSKYVRWPKKHVSKNIKYVLEMQMLAGAKVYELGVGPGYLFTLLEKALGCQMYGCDINLDAMEVYRRTRKVLNITSRVVEHRVTSGKDLGILPGTEAVIAFWTVFNRQWSVADHKWFIEECARNLVGQRLLFLRFNNEGFTDNAGVMEFYDQCSSQPLPEDGNFRRVCLSDFD